MFDSQHSNFPSSYHNFCENLFNMKNSIADISREDLLMKIAYTKSKLYDIETITKLELGLISQYIGIQLWHSGEKTKPARLKCQSCETIFEISTNDIIQNCSYCGGDSFNKYPI